MNTTHTSSNFDLVLRVPLGSGEGITFTPTNDGKRLEVKLDTAYTDGKYVTIHNTGKAYTVYGTVQSEGQIIQTNHEFDQEPITGTNVQRGEGGVVRVGTAVADSDAMPKKQVEDGFVKSVAGTTNAPVVYIRDVKGVDATMPIINYSALPWSIPQRGSSGAVIVGTPVGINDATTKAYVDNLNTIIITAGA